MMELKIDSDLEELALHVQTTYPAEKLVGLSTGLGAIAPALWGHYAQSPVVPLLLRGAPISACDPHIPPCANE